MNSSPKRKSMKTAIVAGNFRFEELRPPVAPPWRKDRGRKRKKGSLFYFSAHIFLPGAVCKQPTWLNPRIAELWQIAYNRTYEF
jgi:hypothetical protein